MRYVLALLFSLIISPALAGVSCVLPFNLQNGTTADATQVMANYNALVSCLGSAAAAGANSDITSLNALTTAIPHSAGGTPVYVGGTTAGSANAQTLSATVPSFILSTGNIVTFTAGFANTGPTTLNVQSTSALPIFRRTQFGIQPLVGGEIINSDEVMVEFDGNHYQCLSCKMDTVGEIKDYAGTSVPAGWLAADGSCQSQATYPTLFAAIGTNYGTCSAGQFALPDGRGNAMVGLDNQGGNGNANRLSNCGNDTTLGALCGAQSRTIAQGNLPNVTLSPSSLTLSVTGGATNVCNGGSCALGTNAIITSSTVQSAVNVLTNGAMTSGTYTFAFGGNVPLGGSGTALTTIQPVQFVFKIIKL